MISDLKFWIDFFWLILNLNDFRRVTQRSLPVKCNHKIFIWKFFHYWDFEITIFSNIHITDFWWASIQEMNEDKPSQLYVFDCTLIRNHMHQRNTWKELFFSKLIIFTREKKILWWHFPSFFSSNTFIFYFSILLYLKHNITRSLVDTKFYIFLM